MQAVIEQGLIPTKEEVLDKVQLAVAAPPVESDKGSALDYGVYASLYKYTLGIDDYISIAAAEAEDDDLDYYEMIPNACRRELLHNQGRYYATPILPYPMDSLSDGTRVLSLDDISSETDVQFTFDAAYPESATGSAWVVQVGDRVYINNSHENMDIEQSFSFDWEGAGRFSGTIQPHSYLLAKRSEEGIWIMANADGKGSYTDDRTTRIELELPVEPDVEGSVESTWNNGTISLSMSHSDGAGSVFLRF
jgi:hypothetical protein